MMWHWNSLWAPAPGDPPAIDDPSLWQAPWTAEQAIALQTRNWEAMLSAAHSWWTMMLSAMPLAPVASGWPLPAWNAGQLDRAAIAGAEPLAVASPTTTEPAAKAARPKRSTSARKQPASRKR
jgi:hypothetical protein